MRIHGVPDQSSYGGKPVGIAGDRWLQSTADDWSAAFTGAGGELTLDMSDIGFMPLYEWVCTVALIERFLSTSSRHSVKIDFIGDRSDQILSAGEYIDIKKGHAPRRPTARADYALSDSVYHVVGFLESLKTRYILNNHPGRSGELYYSNINKHEADLLSFHTRDGKDENTVVLRLTRIETPEDCKQFLDSQMIHNWREDMGNRFPFSPVFESEEFWRVLCHELAVNIWEHAKIPGIIGARVVMPVGENGIKWWCRSAYTPQVVSLLSDMRSGFLEVCVADSGQGFVSTLKKSYMEYSGLTEDKIVPANVLAFAFDRFGTCKTDDESWATERHALGRIRQIVAKYGGVIRLQSGGAEIAYVNGPSSVGSVSSGEDIRPILKDVSRLPGAQMQIILPLTPFFEIKKNVRMRSPLERNLPRSFRTRPEQVRGHLVPLKERLEFPDAVAGAIDQYKFRQACTALVLELSKRAPNEPVVLDFSGLEWVAAQFETLLHHMQNVLQSRPVLLVEIDPVLAREVEELERSSATTRLPPYVLDGVAGATGNKYGEDGKMPFLDTFRRINATVLGLDREGSPYLFGLSDARYKNPLLGLMYREASVEELITEGDGEGGLLREGMLRSILNPNNPTFKIVGEVAGRKLWGTSWDARSIKNEASRVLTSHFDEVAKRSEAWHGQVEEPGGNNQTTAAAPKIFYLPWLAMWREDFLEASRILSRERHADEVAQRLIYRLKVGLGLRGKRLSDVKVLACVTTPSMLLGAALHRWWPDLENRPVVMDLGYYVMLGTPRKLPVMADSDGVLIVQDIVDTHRVSTELIRALREQKAEILGVLSFVRLKENLAKTRATAADEGWLPEEDAPAEDFIPRHAMIEVRRPDEVAGPINEEVVRAFWIEQRSLRPVPYSKLRREGQSSRSLSRRDECLKLFDSTSEGTYFSSGHYVYGRRHYALTVDIRGLLRGEVGDEMAQWLADICEGDNKRQRRVWEREQQEENIVGDVTAVLMPLHSQIYYIWPRIESLLAQRGRRQPNWWLEATLFTGAGPAYFMPKQFTDLISEAVDEVISTVEDPPQSGGGRRDDSGRRTAGTRPLRILVVDDAIATGDTAETILSTVLKVVENEFKKKLKSRGIEGKGMEHYPSPIQWIRYFAILNQMSAAFHEVIHNIPVIGKMKIPVLFEEFAPFMGVPVYDEETCPICKDISRLTQLRFKCERYAISPTAQPWVARRLDELRPVAVDSPSFRTTNPVRLSKTIDVLAASRQSELVGEYLPSHADTAIWRFYELMYLSYPPNDILRSLESAWPDEEGDGSEIGEYERYRWAVLEWCLHNWARIRANAARPTFIEAALKEIERSTELVERILEAASVHFNDPDIARLVADVIDRLVGLEAQRGHASGVSAEWGGRVVKLHTALTVFFLNIQYDELQRGGYVGDSGVTLLDYLADKARSLNPNYPSHARNLHHFLTQPRSFADPKWALERLAESIFRGRDPKNAPAGNHKLLPRLIVDLEASSGMDVERRGLLSTSLAIFLAALENIKPYAHTEPLSGAVQIEEYCRKIGDLLKLPPNTRAGGMLLPELTSLKDSLLTTSEFSKSFNRIFHEEVRNICEWLRGVAAEKSGDLLEFDPAVAPEVREGRVLCDVLKLQNCLANIAIDPISKVSKEGGDGREKYISRMLVTRTKDSNGEERVTFRILTRFTSLDEARKRLERGMSGSAERAMLEQFGVKFKLCEPPAEDEADFTTACEVSVLTGYIPH